MLVMNFVSIYTLSPQILFQKITLRSEKIDIFYSRFTIHSITKEDEIILLPKVFRKLDSGGLFCIEVRTTKDPLYGVGERCGVNTFARDGHKRRFIGLESLERRFY